MKVYQTITDLVGHTPLHEVTKLEAERNYRADQRQYRYRSFRSSGGEKLPYNHRNAGNHER